MRTQLDRLLERLDPDLVLDMVSARTDEAMNSFPFRSARITKWDNFRDCIIRFVAHVECYALRLRSPCKSDPDYAWGRCVRMLMNKFGPSGEKAAFEMARTGNEGGLYAVLQAVAWHIAEQLAKDEIAARVDECLGDLSAEERLAVSTEYLEKYGHLLPSELTEGSAARVHASFYKVLEGHPRLMKRFRQIGRSGPPPVIRATPPKQPGGNDVAVRQSTRS